MLEPWEGQPTPRLYGFTVRQVGAALARVGASYRDTAAWVRQRAGRPLPVRRRGRRLIDGSRHAQLVSDWVSVFAPVIWAAYAPTEWPARLIIDEDEYRAARPAGGRRGQLLFTVLGAVGYPSRSGRPLVCRVQAVDHKPDAVSWADFLTGLGGQPEFVVTDGAPVILSGARMAWPSAADTRAGRPQLYRCEWHLLRGLTQPLARALGEDPRDQPRHPLTRAARTCLTSHAHWVAFEQALYRQAQDTPDLNAAITWVQLNHDRVTTQITNRPSVGPYSLGPLEEAFRDIGAHLDYRAETMTNRHRTNRLLTLLAAHHNGWTDEAQWAEIIREHLHQAHGRAHPQRVFQ